MYKIIPLINNKLRGGAVFFLKSLSFYSYTSINTATTPLSNAQPWWLFYACMLEV